MQGTGNSWKAMGLALLCVVTAAVLSFSAATLCQYTTSCKYIASAGAAANVRAAKWKVALVSPVPASNGIIKFANSTSAQSKQYTVKLTNIGSEVAAAPELSVAVSATAYGGMTANKATASVARTGDSGNVAPGGTATYTLTVTAPAALLTDGYVTANMTWSMTQVN